MNKEGKNGKGRKRERQLGQLAGASQKKKERGVSDRHTDRTDGQVGADLSGMGCQRVEHWQALDVLDLSPVTFVLLIYRSNGPGLAWPGLAPPNSLPLPLPFPPSTFLPIHDQ